MAEFEENLAKVMTSIISGARKETVLTHMDKALDLIELKEQHSDHDFIEFIQFGTMKLYELIEETCFSIPDQKYKYTLEQILNGNYQHFFDRYFKDNEGWPCSHDKTCFVQGMTLKALKENTNLSLYDDYQDTPQVTENKERQAYWSPETIIDTDTAMGMFWDWYDLKEQ